MARKYHERQYDRMKVLELRIKDAHSACMQFQSTFDSYLEALDRIFKSKEYLGLPHYRREYLRGIWDTLFSQMQNQFVWVLIGPDGVKYGPHNDAWLERDSAYKEAMTGEHVWPKAWALGEFRPFGKVSK